MRVRFTVHLPAEAGSVPVIRRLCRSTMTQLGVEADCIDDIVLAVTEACTNVVRHAQQSSKDFVVHTDLGEELCEIQVVDDGPGFAPDSTDNLPEPLLEAGRGISLMRHLVDELQFERHPGRGTVVHLQKHLDLTAGSLLAADATRP